MTHVGGMYASLILSSSLQLELDQGMLGGAAEHMEMADGQLATVVVWRRIGDVGLVVLQPVLYGALVLLHLTAEDGHVATVVDYLMPVVLKNLLGVDVLGIDHQSAGVAVEAMHDMSRTLLT